MMANVIRAMGRSNAVLRGIMFGLTVGSILGLVGATYMLINNIEVSTVINMVQEFSLGKELIKLITSSIK